MNQIRAARSPWILWIAAAAFALVTLACETGEPAAPPSEDEIAANTATATAEPPADSAGTAAPAPTAATTAAPPTAPPNQRPQHQPLPPRQLPYRQHRSSPMGRARPASRRSSRPSLIL